MDSALKGFAAMYQYRDSLGNETMNFRILN